MLGEIFKWTGLLLLGIGVSIIAYHYNQRLLEWLRLQSIGTRDYIAEKLVMMFIEIPPHYILLAQLISSFGLGLIVFTLLIPNWFASTLFGVMVTAIGWKAPKPIVDWMYRRRIQKFILQMIDGLGLMSNGLKSGLSVVQAIGLVVQEIEDPMRQEFGLVLNETRVGVPLEEALLNLSKRVISDDVEMFVTAVNILKETGGNLAETFDTIVLTIRDRIKVEQKIQALTAQGLYQGMFVVAIPPVMCFLFYQMDPVFMKPLFTTPLGLVLILVILLLEVIGFFVIMHIIKIDV